MSKKIFITGANGFLGFSITKIALKKKFKVRALVRRNSNISHLKKLNVEIVYGDLRDYKSLESAVKDCKIFFHVAADYRLWVRKRPEIYESNVHGTQNLIEAVKKINNHRMIFTSSVATIGNSDGVSDENTFVDFSQMIGDYKKSKYLSEKIIKQNVDFGSLNCIIVNPSTPIGPGDLKPTPTGNVILQVLLKKMPAYVETGLNIVHVDDVALGHFQALEKGKIGERYILGGDDLEFKKFLDLICNYAKLPMINFRMPRKPLYPLAYLNQSFAMIDKNYTPMLTVDGLKMSEHKMFFSSEKAKKYLGYRPRNANSAIKDSVDWFRNFFIK
tara:strand:- start:618 stop:1607 length:990 start_codon:yes stop_codon:yes gene_type:complete